MDLKLALKQFGRAIDSNSPTILSGLAVAGVLGTVIMAIRATPKAMKAIDEELNYRMDEMAADDPDPELSISETANVCWQFYIPTMLMGATTITCIVMANHISTRRYAAVSSLLAFAETAAREYERKVEETIGERKAQKIHEDIAQDHLDKNPISEQSVIFTGGGDYLCFDSFSSRYFRTNIDKVQRAANTYNQRLLQEGWLSINYFYDELGLEEVELYQEYGWVGERGLLEIKAYSKLATVDGKQEPCMVIDYRVTPHHI